MHSVHPLINEARRAFPAAREDYTCARRGELGSDSTDQQGVGCGDAVAGASRLLSVTRALLLVNADHGSAWNARKALVRDGVHESINVRQEIKAGFCQMARTQMPLIFVTFRVAPAVLLVRASVFSMLFPAPHSAPFVYELQMLYSVRYVFHSRQRATSDRHAPVCLLVFVHTYLGPALLSNVAISLDLHRYRMMVPQGATYLWRIKVYACVVGRQL